VPSETVGVKVGFNARFIGGGAGQLIAVTGHPVRRCRR
jgi:hypothetical protein